jgi:hypothetical protein
VVPDVRGDFYGVLSSLQVVHHPTVPPVVNTEVVGQVQTVAYRPAKPETPRPARAVEQPQRSARAHAAPVNRNPFRDLL